MNCKSSVSWVARPSINLNQITEYAYDLAGNHIREKTTQAGVVYQDNQMAYDAQGQLRWVGDGRAYVSIEYDEAGNRTHIQTHVINGTAAADSNRYFSYDEMNRQTLVDGLDAGGTLSATQGHRLSYDANGNRTQDVYCNGASLVTETYSYDAQERLGNTWRNGALVDWHLYDAAGRAVQSGTMSQPGVDFFVNRYDANGRLLTQRVLVYGGGAKYTVNYTSYDAAGKVLSYQLVNYSGTRYTNTLRRCARAVLSTQNRNVPFCPK